MFTASLIFAYALSTNDPLFIRSHSAPYRDEGVRLEIHAPLPHGFYLDVAPYMWKSREHSVGSNGGATLRIGWENKYLGVALMHKSEHNFDRVSRGGHIDVNMVEVEWKLK